MCVDFGAFLLSESNRFAGFFLKIIFIFFYILFIITHNKEESDNYIFLIFKNSFFFFFFRNVFQRRRRNSRINSKFSIFSPRKCRKSHVLPKITRPFGFFRPRFIKKKIIKKITMQRSFGFFRQRFIINF